MGLIRGLLDRIVLVVAVIAGGLLPSFAAQYRQRVGGRLDQVLQDLAPFQEIANRYHGGSLEALVKHHLASPDPTFHDEGAAIQAMMEAAAQLRAAYQALEGTLLQQLTYLVTRGDPEIARATLEVYQPAFGLDTESLVFAAVSGVVVWLAFLAVWAALGAIGSAITSRGRARMSPHTRVRAG